MRNPVRAAAITKRESSSGGGSRGGRPLLDRARWNAATFRSMWRSLFASADETAEALNVARHAVYAWSNDEGYAPTPDQAKHVAAVLSEYLGSRVRPVDLGREVSRITFRFDG